MRIKRSLTIHLIPPSLPPSLHFLPVCAAVRDLGISATVTLAVVRAVGSILHVAIIEREGGREREREGGDGRVSGGCFPCRVLVWPM